MRFRRKKTNEATAAQLAAEIDTVVASLRQKEDSRITFGAPSRCPVCGNFGFIEGVDVQAGRVDNRCLTCGEEWAITRRALRAVAAEPILVGAPKADGGGILVEQAAGRVEVGTTSEQDLRVLLVEDDPADAALLQAVLEPATGASLEIVTASSRRDGERLASGGERFDLVLLDLGLPDSSGLSTLANWQPATPSPPVVVVSGNDNPALVSATRSHGARGFVHKSQLADLVSDDQGASALVQSLRSVASSH